MKRKVRTIIILVLIVLAIVLVYIFGKPGTPEMNEDGSFEGETSLDAIAALNKPYQCTFTKDDGSSQVNGSIMLSEGKMRGDFDIRLNAQDGGIFASHFIIKDGINYTWTSIQPVGFKAKVATNSSRNASPAEQAQIIGTKEKVSYKCAPWNANLTMFELPSGITFLDLPKQ